MKKMILKVTNDVAYLSSCYGVGFILGKIVEKIFGRFLTDEAYAEQHPWKYLLGVLAIMLVELSIGLAIIWVPLMKLRNFIDSKIEDRFDEKKEEWD